MSTFQTEAIRHRPALGAGHPHARRTTPSPQRERDRRRLWGPTRPSVGPTAAAAAGRRDPLAAI
jgi:hypothetical protein